MTKRRVEAPQSVPQTEVLVLAPNEMLSPDCGVERWLGPSQDGAMDPLEVGGNTLQKKEPVPLAPSADGMAQSSR